MVGLLTTLTLLATLIIAYIKVQAHRRSGAQQNQQPQVQQEQQEQLQDNLQGQCKDARKTFMATSPSTSDEPDVVQMQMSKLGESSILYWGLAATYLGQKIKRIMKILVLVF